MRRKRKQRHGRFCWACDRRRPNEWFKGGRRGVVCRSCRRLAPDELEFRLACKEVRRMLLTYGRVLRGRRRRVEHLLSHRSERVRAFVADALAEPKHYAADDYEIAEYLGLAPFPEINLLYAAWDDTFDAPLAQLPPGDDDEPPLRDDSSRWMPSLDPEDPDCNPF